MRTDKKNSQADTEIHHEIKALTQEMRALNKNIQAIIQQNAVIIQTLANIELEQQDANPFGTLS